MWNKCLKVLEKQLLSCFHFEDRSLSHFVFLKRSFNTAGISGQVSKDRSYKNGGMPHNSHVFSWKRYPLPVLLALSALTY